MLPGIDDHAYGAVRVLPGGVFKISMFFEKILADFSY
jgi:hypothetical protein